MTKLQTRMLVATMLLPSAAWPVSQVGTTELLAQYGAHKSFVIARTDSPPLIDGNLDDDVWLHAAVIDDFHQTTPKIGEAPSESTVVRVLYDDNFIYIAAELRDSDPENINASQMIQGRNFFSDDRFWVTIDSFNSKRNDYFFQVNANGIRREALRENNSRFIDEWVAIWRAESSLHDNGWATEIAIPFKSISFDPDSDTWGINFGRGIARKQEFNMWSSYERQDWPAYGGQVSGIRDIEQGLGLDVIPSVNLIRRKEYRPDANTTTDFEPSLDVTYKLTPSLSAALTLNTDFSAAEIDDQQIALDRFSLFFPEKRDFFLQDAGIFEFGNIDTNGRPFFSRRIGLSDDGEPIGLDAGIKLTGRVGRYNIGALAVRQEAYEDIAASDLMVARGSANLFKESTAGFIATYGDPTSNATNSLVGADYLYRNSNGLFGQIVEGQAWFQQSTTRGLDGEDQAYGLNLELPNDRVTARLGAMVVQDNFNPGLGFVNRAGIRRYNATFRYRTRPDAGRWRTINHRIDAVLVTDMQGTLLSQLTRIRPVTLFSNGSDFLMVEWQAREENVTEAFSLFNRLEVPAGNYKFDRYRAEISSGVQRPVSVVLSVQDGGFFDGTRLEKYFEFQWRQSEHFSMDLRYTENDTVLPDGRFKSRLASLRTDVAFDSRWSWSNIVQYNNSDDRIAFNSRLKYMPDAGKQVLLILNHGAMREDDRFRSESSELNLKLSYTFRY